MGNRMKLFKHSRITKKYALAAVNYRRVARRSGHMDQLKFGLAELEALYDYETFGIGSVDKKTNGYTYGKWLVDLSVSMWIEDIKRGDAVKWEFISTPITRLQYEKKLEAIIPGRWFPRER